MAILGNPISVGGAGGAKLNVFSGTTQPTTYNGIWINSSQAITNVVQDNDVWTPNTFYNTNVALTDSAFANSADTNKVFYYNGYIYKFQNNAKGRGLYKAPINTAVFTQVISTTDIPLYGLAQDQANPRYLYGLVGSSSSVSTGKIHKYDLASGTDTIISTNLNYYQWTYAFQEAVVYNGYFYGFYYSSSSQSSYPSKLFKYNLNSGGNSITAVFDTTSVKYPRLELVGSNLYMMYTGTTGSTLNVRKFDLTSSSSTSAIMTLSGSTDVGVSNLDRMIHATDGANKIYFIAPSSDTYTQKLFVLNVDTGAISSYTDSNAYGVRPSYSSMLYYNDVIYIYGICIGNSATYGIHQFKLTGKSYASGTFVITRTSNNGGTNYTELVSPKDRISGSYNLFKTGYNMAYISVNGQLTANQSVYNGTGSSWVQIR